MEAAGLDRCLSSHYHCGDVVSRMCCCANEVIAACVRPGEDDRLGERGSLEMQEKSGRSWWLLREAEGQHPGSTWRPSSGPEGGLLSFTPKG